MLYAGTRPLKLSLKQLRELRDAIALPPVSATPPQLWRAFQAVEALQVRETVAPQRAGETLADLVQLVRHAIEPRQAPLTPYAEQVRLNFSMWMMEKERAGVTFTADQIEWLTRMADHIATSLAIEPEDFQTGWFAQHGSLGRAHSLFGEKLKPLLVELNERLAA